MAKQHSPEVRAAVIAALLEGQSIHQVAREYKIPRTTVRRWNQEGGPSNGPQKKEIGELILDYLRANLETLYVQAQHFRDKNWLGRQSAENLAVLHGVMTDKAIRLLEAYGRAEDDSGTGAED